MSTVFFLNGDSVADNSEHAVAITNTGVVVSTAQSRFGGSSLYFNGSANLTFRLKEDCFAGTHDWTVDWWEYRLGAKTSSAVFCRPITSSASSGLILCDDNGQGGLSMYESSSGSSHNIASGVKIGTRTLNAWVHRAVVKKNGVYTAYENGVKVTSVTYTGSIAASTTPMRIGNYGTSMFYGYIDEFRISDVALWSENFNPTVINDVDESEITELEYIQSSGTQYVDTSFKPTGASKVVFDFQMVNQSTTQQALFGSRPGTTGRFTVFTGVSTDALQAEYNTQASLSKSNAAISGLDTNNRNTIKLSNSLVVNGVVVNTIDAISFTSAYNLWLFANNNNGTAQLTGSEKLYSCQIYDNGLLERDYIPAMLYNGEVGLYDRVFHEFYRNAGTGEFTAGTEMVHEDYTELEYIESDGAQCVDTGVVGNQSIGFEVDFETANSVSSSGQGTILGCLSSASARYEITTWTNNAYDGQFCFGANTYDASITQNIRMTMALHNGTLTTPRGTVSVNTGAFSSGISMALFGRHRQNVGFDELSKTKIYSCRFYDDGADVRVYIPMLHPSGVAGLWDSVNERFYASATTTDFIAGPEVSKTPNAPSTFQLDSVNDTSIVVSWQTVTNALGYKLWLNGSLIADTTETTVTVTVEPFTCMVLSLVAYNENGNSPVVTLTHQYAPDNPILWLVTDRTAQDAALGNTKGTYNASDLNRVGYAVAYLADKLASCGVKTTVHPKTDWLTTDIPSEQVLVTYLQNVRTLRTALTLVASVPEVPQDMQFFTHTEANDIEMLLVMLDTHITNMLSNVDTSWAVGSTYTGLYAREAYR